MKKHTKIYMEYFDYFGDEFIPCDQRRKIQLII